MKIANTYIIFLTVITLFSCSSSKTKATPEQLHRMSKLLDNMNFEITSDMAYPQVSSAMVSLQNSGLIAPGSSVNQISLIGNENYVKLVGDSIYAELPYFGERQMSSGYNGSDTSISIKDIMQNYNVTENPKDNSVMISFDAKTKREILRFNITLFSNLNTSMQVNSSTRFPIRYSGSAVELSK